MNLDFDPYTFSFQKLCCRCDIKVARNSDADKLAMEEADAPTPGAIERYDNMALMKTVWSVRFF